jgi:hypothetical protein
MGLQIPAEVEAGLAQEVAVLEVLAGQVLLFCEHYTLLKQLQVHPHIQRQMSITYIRLLEMGALSTNGYS